MRLLISGSICLLAFAANALVAQDATPSDDVEQRLRVVERKLELADEQKAEKEKSAVTVAAGGEGFTLKSAAGDFQLKLRGYLQVDGRFFLDDEKKPATDTLLIRRARPVLEGTLYKIFDFRLMTNFGNGQSTLYDAYLEARFSKAVRVRAGKFKPPIGLERLQSATDLVFVERAAPTLLVPSRDVGVQLGGEFAAGMLEYALGVFNGVVDAGVGDFSSEDSKELAARLFWRPFQPADGGVAKIDLGLGLAASRGEQLGTATAPQLASYKTTGGQTFYSFRSDGTAAGTVIADGDRKRIAPQAWLYLGPFGAQIEVVRSEQAVRLDTATADLANSAWQVQLSWVLTGERNSWRGVAPRHPFDREKKAYGAWIVGVRLSELEIDDTAFPRYADPAKSARSAKLASVGLSWNLVRGVRWMLDYDVIRFDGGAAAGDRPDEKVLLTRFQLAF